MRRTAIIVSLALIVGCGPDNGVEEPESEPYEFLQPPTVTFSEALDIELDVPGDPGKLPLAEAVWKLEPGRAIALAGHVLAIVDERQGTVLAVDVRSGEEIWHQKIPQCLLCNFRLTPVFDGERFVVSSGDTLIALDAADGKEAWQLELDGLPDGDGTLVGDKVLALRTLERKPGLPCGSVTTRIHFVDTATGNLIWRIEYVGLFASFTVSGGFLHAVVSEGCDPDDEGPPSGYAMRVYSLLNREEIGKTEAAEPWAPPTVAAGRVILQGSSSLVAYEPGSVDLAWMRKLGKLPQSLVGTPSTLFAIHHDSVEAIDPATGETLYVRDLQEVKFSQGLNVLSTVAASSEVMLIPTVPDPIRGYIVVLDPATGQVRRFFLGFGVVSQSLLWGGIGVLLTSEEVVAIDVVQEGTPERDLVPVSAAVMMLVDEISEQVPFVPWEAVTFEVERLGPEALDKLVTLSNEGSLVAGLLFARLLQQWPDAKHVESLVALLASPGAGTDESLVPLYERMIWETIKALAVSGSDEATAPLADLVRDKARDPALRSTAWAALGKLAAGGDDVALEEIVSYRKMRIAQTDDGWSPCPVPRTTFRYEGPFTVPTSGCSVDEDTAFPVSSSVMSTGGEWLAYVSPTLGGRNDVWLVRFDGVDVEGPWYTGWTMPGHVELQYVGDAEDSQVVMEGVEKECLGCYYEDEDRPDTGKPDEVFIETKDLARDTDKDGWTDLVEERLGTGAKKKDSDGDGEIDTKDPAPMASSKKVKNYGDHEHILVEAFFGLLGFGRSAEPLYVVGQPQVNLDYRGYRAVVLHASEEQARQIHKTLGIPGPPMVKFGCTITDNGTYMDGCIGESGDPADFIALDDAQTQATFSLTIYRSDADAALYRVGLTRLGESWIVTQMDLAIFG